MAALEHARTQYFPVEQRSEEWKKLRRPISGTSGKHFGFCSFTDPVKAYAEAIAETRTEISSAACDHGNKFEPSSERVFRDWLSTNVHYRDQTYTSPGYDVPNPLVNSVFNEERDALRFGVSLDVRGSMIDCEIKNPTTYSSFLRYYLPMFSPAYFFQVQWAMTMRGRKEMFLIATSYNAATDALEGCVIWRVQFAERYVCDTLVPLARVVADAILAKRKDFRVEDVCPWINKSNRFARSPEYARIFTEHCTAVHVKTK